MEEIWKPIKDYEGYYEVSNLGRVRSLDRFVENKLGICCHFNGGILVPGVVKDGYLQVNLYKNGLGTSKSIHTLVAEAFLENPNNYIEVNHIDHNRQNNCVSNLEWVTRQQNIDDMVMYNLKTGNFRYSRKFHIGYFDCNIDKCPICGELKNIYSDKCLSCYRKQIAENIPEKSELIHDLLIRNFSKIKEKYNVSDNAVRKWCKKYNLPFHTKDLKNMTDEEILSL